MEIQRRKFIKHFSTLGLGLSAIGPSMDRIAQSYYNKIESEGETPVLFFDGYTEVGPQRVSHSKERKKLGDLIKEMDYCSISGALVASTMSLSYDAHFSNLRLSKDLEPYPYLFAIWNVMPHITGEFPNPEELGKHMKEHNVRAVMIHPKSNSWDWKGSHCDELFNWLSDQKILTIIPNFGELGTWNDVDIFLKKYSQLPVLLKNISWAAQRYVIPLVKRHSNLHISFETFQINEGLEYFHEEGLTDQLVFASNTPTMSAGAHRTYVDYAQIPRTAREKIASGNLIRLLQGQKPPKEKNNRNEDILMKSIRRGLALPIPIIDMHMHILHEGLHGAGRHYRMKNGGPSAVFSLINKLGYAGGGIMSWDGVVSQDARSGNHTTKAALDSSPGGYWGLGTFDPTQFTQSEMKKMIENVYSDPRFIGMKPYLLYGREYHHPSYDVWWEYGNKNHFYGLLHNSRSDLLETDVLAGKYPNVRWVIAHAGNSFSMAEKSIEIMKKHSNVFAEVTYTTVPLGAVEYLVEEAGADRILYGSDLPMRDPRPQLGWVVFSDLSLEIKKKILTQNAINVIEPCWNRLPAKSRPTIN